MSRRTPCAVRIFAEPPCIVLVPPCLPPRTVAEGASGLARREIDVPPGTRRLDETTRGLVWRRFRERNAMILRFASLSDALACHREVVEIGA